MGSESTRLNLILTTILIVITAACSNSKEQATQLNGIEQLNPSAIFLPISLIRPAQTRISLQNVQRKIRKDGAKYAPNQRLIYDQERSLYPLSDPVVVTKVHNGYVLLDGHHSTYAAIQMGAQTIAAKVVGDISHLSENELWVHLSKKHQAFLLNTDGSMANSAPSFNELKDDPHRYLATRIARKVKLADNGSIKKSLTNPTS